MPPGDHSTGATTGATTDASTGAATGATKGATQGGASATPLSPAAVLNTVLDGRSLDEPEAEQTFTAILAGSWSPVQIAALLAGLRAKGETPAELAGAAKAMLAAAAPMGRPEGLLMDTCGTGGDGHHTVNVSTAAALVVAAAGVPVAKHGNRSVSSRSGSADVLEACGVRMNASGLRAEQSLRDTGFCFLFAPAMHPGLAPVMPVRRGLGVRTLFNLLGPLVNPARPSRQVIGVYAPRWCVPVAQTLHRLGCERALVVHGAGLDEIALHGETTAALLEGGDVREVTLTPEQAGLARHPLSALAGGTPEDNAAWLRSLLAGGGTAAHRDAVALNAGAALWMSGREPDLRAGAARARAVLDSGDAARLLERAAAASQGAPSRQGATGDRP